MMPIQTPRSLSVGNRNTDPEARWLNDPPDGGLLRLSASRPGPKRIDTRPESCEGAARATLDSHAGRILTDAEWARAQGRLLEFFTILRAWHQKIKGGTVGLNLVSFEVPCLREL